MQHDKLKELINREKTVELFLELVQIDSIPREERMLADRIIELAGTLGLDIKEDETAEKIDGNAGNLIISVPGDETQAAVLLSAHLDRVEPGKGIKPVIKGEYIESSGDTVLAGDDLIGVTAIMEAIRILKENQLEHRPFKVIFSVAEEIGLLGAKNLDPEELSGLKYGFVLDGDGEIGTIINQGPAQIKYNMEIRGRAAHAGMEPERGINAIKMASAIISRLKTGRIDEETTANIGVIKGGMATNIVPDLVELEGEVRSHSPEKITAYQEEMMKIIEEVSRKYQVNVSCDFQKLYDGFAISTEDDIIKFTEKINEEIGVESKFVKSGGGSDANIFNGLGLTTLNLGVGMENVHSREERVKIANLELMVLLVLKILTKKDS
ncbi:MAG: M20/M25/M40 family metallo-hydrolase [Halanaerobiales bacterium]